MSASTASASTPRRALLLVNLGTPARPDAAAVREYLGEFLLDPRVVQIPRWLWKPLLQGVILPRRSPVVAQKYAEIWTDEGSPLLAHSRRLTQRVQALLPDWTVALAMRYGQPALAAEITRLHAQGIRQLVLLPLYPQYSTTTTASVDDLARATVAGLPGLELKVIADYHRDPGWVEAIAASIREHWRQHGRGERLLLSFHGIPERLVRQGDPYAAQCEAGTAAIAEALGIARDEILLTYQSRFGRERWLQPYTLQTVEQLGREGVQRLDVACPGFAVDCLETLEEIRLQNADALREAGGGELRYIACLNDRPDHAAALAALATSLA
ncbi:ferrochelatase [Luteimonas sp. e5]